MKQTKELTIYHIDCEKCIAKGKAQALKQVMEIIDKLIPYDEEGSVYPDLLSKKKLKAELEKLK